MTNASSPIYWPTCTNPTGILLIKDTPNPSVCTKSSYGDHISWGLASRGHQVTEQELAMIPIRSWAPSVEEIDCILDDTDVPMKVEETNYHLLERVVGASEPLLTVEIPEAMQVKLHSAVGAAKKEALWTVIVELWQKYYWLVARRTSKDCRLLSTSPWIMH